ncbi:MAG: DUF4836 family protein [Ferruginibacter sp.]
MQTRSRLSILFFITAFVVFSSCSKKTNKEGRYIPKTAGVVFLLNGESMSAKLPWEEIKQNDLFKSLSADTSLESYIKSTLDNPENTGIDTKKNLLFFVVKDSLGGYVGFEGTVKDAAKFKAYNAAVSKGAVESDKDGIHFFKTERITSSYDKEKFVVIIDAPEMSNTNSFGRSSSKRDAIATATQVYNLSEDNSLAKDEKFSNLVSTKSDILFWVSAHSLMSDNASMAALSMLNIGKLYEDSYMTGAINFDNGKINVDVKSYAGKELTDLYKKYGGTTLNTDMIKRIPAKDVVFLLAISYKPEGLKEFLKITGMDGFVNMGAAKLGITFDDFTKANKGDVLVSVSDIKKDSSGRTNVNALFATAIADKNAFGKLIEAGNKISAEMLGPDADKFISYKSDDKFFAIGTDKPSVEKFVSSANNSNPGFLDKISSASSALYLNLPLLMTSLNDQSSKDSLDNIAFETTIKTWENIIATGGGFKDGASTSHIEFNLMDKNTNSLKQLNKYIGTIGSIEEQKRLKREKWMNEAMTEPATVDTLSVIPETK